MTYDSHEIELQEVFINEASERLEEAYNMLLSWDGQEQDSSFTDHLYRLLHNIKGAAGTFNIPKFVSIIHAYETCLQDLRDEKTFLNQSRIDVFLEKTWFLQEIIATLEPGKFDEDFETSQFIEDLFTAGFKSVNPEFNKPKTDSGFTLFDDFPEEEPHKVSAQPKKVATHSQIRSMDKFSVPLEIVEKLMSLSGEQQILQDSLKREIQRIKNTSNIPQIEKIVESMGSINQSSQSVIMKMRLVPLTKLFLFLKKTARQTAEACGKDIVFEMSENQLELDKKVVDALTEPLTHLVRNAVDHGIEDAELRQSKGKSPTGKISLDARMTGTRMEIILQDDGPGVNYEAILKKAVEKGVISKDSNPTKEEIMELIFSDGFSTRDEVSEISGRGVGMGAVRRAVIELRGSLTLNSSPEEGSRFTIQLPLNFGMVEGLVVPTKGFRALISLDEIREIVDLQSLNSTVSSDQKSRNVYVRGMKVLGIDLDELLGAGASRNDLPGRSDGVLIILDQRASDMVGVIVPEVERQVRAVARPLAPELEHLVGHVGMTILGDGHPAPILALNRLIEHYYVSNSQQKGTD